jgi:AAA domain
MPETPASPASPGVVPGKPAPPPAPPGARSTPRPASSSVQVPGLAMATKSNLPPRIVLVGVEGWGKTTFGAYAPQPAVLMARGESGFQTLVDHDLVPPAPAVELQTWQETLAILERMSAQQDNHFRTLVLDALGGFERLNHEFVCARDFKGDWGDKGFGSFGKGVEVAASEWQKLLVLLDAIRKQGIGIILLCHSEVRPFRNPIGPDFDRYTANLTKQTWKPTHAWADAVFFGTFVTVVTESKGRAKGIGGSDRIVYTVRSDAYDAKNRYAMPPEIDIPADPSQVYTTIMTHIQRE